MNKTKPTVKFQNDEQNICQAQFTSHIFGETDVNPYPKIEGSPHTTSPFVNYPTVKAQKKVTFHTVLMATKSALSPWAPICSPSTARLRGKQTEPQIHTLLAAKRISPSEHEARCSPVRIHSQLSQWLHRLFTQKIIAEDSAQWFLNLGPSLYLLQYQLSV